MTDIFAPEQLDRDVGEITSHTLRFTIPGEPVPWMRARERVVRAKTGRHFVQHFVARSETEYRSIVAWRAKALWRNRPLLDSAIAMTLEFYRSVPTSLSKRERDLALAGQLAPITKPDASNCCKLIEDALNGVVYVDDAQIVHSVQFKRYGDPPRTVVSISWS